MELVDFNKPGEKKKLIWASALGLVAVVFLWWTFVGFGGGTAASKSAKPSATGAPGGSGQPRQAETVSTTLTVLASDLRDIVVPQTMPSVPEPKRNIFAYYEPPKVVKEVQTPTPTATPTPPVLLAAISPSNVYAKTADFTLEATGDQFTPDLHIFVDGRELATKFRGPQQLSTTIAASFIANPGTRQIELRTTDGRAYSNALPLSVAPPPTPNYSYVGIIGTTSHVDTAMLQDRNNKEILSVQRGTILSGRFRVTSISEKEVVFVDVNLKIKHNLAMSEGEKAIGLPLARPTPRVDAEDDEP
jgi:hypothetical protein